jgi:MFS family permease
MLPSYLILEHGLDQTTVNAVVSGSRIAGLLALLLSGLLVDRFGERAVITGIVLLTGACTIFLGLFRGPMVLAAVFLQPMFADAFFPAGLSALAKIGSSRMHTLFVSLIIPMGYAFGAGVVPTIMGYTADLGRFPMGFLSLGVAILLTLPAAQQLPVERGIKRA